METSVSPHSAKPLIARNPKACQECRKRKVKCDAVVPCSQCKLRNRECTYRVAPRPNRRKRATGNQSPDTGDGPQNPAIEGERRRSLSTAAADAGNSAEVKNSVHYSSVAATHLASPSCELQVHYGPTSNFSMMQLIYRHLISHANAHNDNHAPGSSEHTGRGTADGDEVEEAGPGLDLFSFRRLFFGDMEKASGKTLTNGDGANQALMFLPERLAEQFLNRYLVTVYHSTPFLSPEEFRALLKAVYSGTDPGVFESASSILLLLGLAIGAAMTDHSPWGETLFQKAKVHAHALDDVINLQAVQIPLLMAYFQIENGRTNSAFLYTGFATRKAFAAGLHKGVNLRNDQTGRNLQERKATIWLLYFYETYTFSSFSIGSVRI